MKTKITESIPIPSGVDCSFSDNTLRCKKGSSEAIRVIKFPDVKIAVKEGNIVLSSDSANKKQINFIMSTKAHVRNMFFGLNNKFVYKLQSASVHFPMTLKVEKENLVINNFLGEKRPRLAHILPHVEVKVTGANITVTSHDREAAGQTAANMEKATKIRNRDRRVFQDGIYITDKDLEEAK